MGFDFGNLESANERIKDLELCRDHCKQRIADLEREIEQHRMELKVAKADLATERSRAERAEGRMAKLERAAELVRSQKGDLMRHGFHEICVALAALKGKGE